MLAKQKHPPSARRKLQTSRKPIRTHSYRPIRQIQYPINRQTTILHHLHRRQNSVLLDCLPLKEVGYDTGNSKFHRPDRPTAQLQDPEIPKRQRRRVYCHRSAGLLPRKRYSQRGHSPLFPRISWSSRTIQPNNCHDAVNDDQHEVEISMGRSSSNGSIHQKQVTS